MAPRRLSRDVRGDAAIDRSRRKCPARVQISALNNQVRGLAGFSRLRVLPQLKAFRAVSCRRIVPVLHPARFSRKMPEHLQGSRIPGTHSGSPVLQTGRIQSHIWRTSDSFSSHCRSSGKLSSNRGCSSRDVPIRMLSRLTNPIITIFAKLKNRS